MKASVVLTAMVLGCMAPCGPAWAEMKINSKNKDALAFVMEVEAPTTASSLVAKSEDVIFEQPLRPSAAVRVDTAFTVPYVLGERTTGIAIDFNRPESPTVTVPAGFVFVMAVGREGEFYCLAGAAREDGEFSGAHDVGVCLRDADKDGVFELARATDLAPERIRVPYEISCLCRSTDTPVQVRYAQVPIADIPRATLQAKYHYRTRFISGRPRLSFGLCWPASLITATAVASSAKECASLNWKIPDDRMEEDVPLPITWGYVQLSITRLNDRSAKVELGKSLEVGPSLLRKVGYRFNSSTVWQQSVFQLRRLTPVKSELSANADPVASGAAE